jgi:hypothetical protein
MSNWSELVGLDVNIAFTMIHNQYPDLILKIVPEDAMLTMDFKSNRVIIFATPEKKVARIPKIG